MTLATKTLREKLAFIDNTFATTPHATIFELFRLDSEKSPLRYSKKS